MRVETLAASAILALLAFGGQTSAGTIQFDAGKFPAISKVDERFQSYNIEMAEIIGAQFWKPYAHMSKTIDTKAPPNVAHDPNLFESRPPLALGKLRLLASAGALAPAYIRVSGTWANTVHFQNNDDPQPPAPPAGFRG